MRANRQETKEIDSRVKISKRGHLKLKRHCPCGSSNAMLKRNSKEIKCTKCKRVHGGVKNDKIQ